MGRKRKRQRRRRKMKGGTAPFIVDFKKGFELLTNKDMWRLPSKADKRAWERDKRLHRESGTKDSFHTWMRKKGRVQKKACCVM